ncbi:MAG: triose-phosphate isomerase [Planctomycetes bacterium]|nr:triose-phosphate isomerase [Planctomycetota bacterium]
MHLRIATARALAEQAAAAAAEVAGPDVAVFPAFVHLATVREALRGSRVALGAQTSHEKQEGAHTGKVSPEMLADVGVTTVLCGHSERRQSGETDQMVRALARAALRAGLTPVICVGETLAEREADRTEEVLRRQVSVAVDGLSSDDLSRVELAYEPVWAIGTGRTATAAMATSAHRVVRDVLVSKFGEAGLGPRILYGGSVKPSNAAELMNSEGVDGVLVGGASLEGPSFRAILLGAVRS